MITTKLPERKKDLRGYGVAALIASSITNEHTRQNGKKLLRILHLAMAR